MSKKMKVMQCLDKLYWKLVFLEQSHKATEVFGILFSLKRAENQPALRAWAVKARKVLSNI